MPEVSHTGENHRDPVLVSGSDNFIITYRATGLNHSCGAGFDSGQQSIGKREEGVGRNNGTPCQ